ncbi:hypothetical protein AGMMS49953_10370 [Endomicrobiia bacterium]|nr:hypothetical protein AGMMS49953_10370 [Endomicrobiia bacterium]
MAKYDYYFLKKQQAQWNSTNELLQKIWKYGEVRKLCDCTSKGCFNYAAKYMLKQARINYRKTLVEAKGRVATAKKDKILIMCDKNGRLAPFRQYSKALGLGFNREFPASIVASADVFTNAATAGSVGLVDGWSTTFERPIFGILSALTNFAKIGICRIGLKKSRC